MISSIQQTASNLQAILRGLDGGGGTSAGAGAGAAGIRPVRGLDESTAESGVGVRPSPSPRTPAVAQDPREDESRQDPEDPATQALQNIQASVAARSNIAVIQDADQRLGTLLDLVG